jgi:hypothetical protein
VRKQCALATKSLKYNGVVTEQRTLWFTLQKFLFVEG